MTASHAVFDKRVKRIQRQHRKMKQGGVVHAVSHDGLIMARPRRQLPRFPIKALVFLVAAVFLFKAFLFISLGPTEYQSRVETLAAGTSVEQAGGMLMQTEPVTLWIVEMLQRYVL